MSTVTEDFTDYIDAVAEEVSVSISVLHIESAHATDVVFLGLTLQSTDSLVATDASFGDAYALMVSTAAVTGDVASSSVDATTLYTDRIRAHDTWSVVVSEFATSSVVATDQHFFSLQLTGGSQIQAADSAFLSTTAVETGISIAHIWTTAFVVAEAFFVDSAVASDTPFVQVYPALTFTDQVNSSDTFFPTTYARAELFVDGVVASDTYMIGQSMSALHTDQVQIRSTDIQTVSPGAL